MIHWQLLKHLTIFFNYLSILLFFIANENLQSNLNLLLCNLLILFLEAKYSFGNHYDTKYIISVENKSIIKNRHSIKYFFISIKSDYHRSFKSLWVGYDCGSVPLNFNPQRYSIQIITDQVCSMLQRLKKKKRWLQHELCPEIYKVSLRLETMSGLFMWIHCQWSTRRWCWRKL